MSIPYTQDSRAGSPSLHFYLNEDNLSDLPTTSRGCTKNLAECVPTLLKDGFCGIQLTTSKPAAAAPLNHCALDRINTAAEAENVIARHACLDHTCLTVHAGWGLEDDDAVDRLVEAILNASVKHRLPVYVETHRATITQDIWRTVRLVERFPEIRFNGDFSHYYTGQEMVYGGLKMKLDFLQPVFERVAFLHARIGSPGQIQVAIGKPHGRPLNADGDIDFLADFKEIWTRAMCGFLGSARRGDSLIFCPELLPRRHYYARTQALSDGTRIEESDRYEEAVLYQEVAKECWNNALSKCGKKALP